VRIIIEGCEGGPVTYEVSDILALVVDKQGQDVVLASRKFENHLEDPIVNYITLREPRLIN